MNYLKGLMEIVDTYSYARLLQPTVRYCVTSAMIHLVYVLHVLCFRDFNHVKNADSLL